MPDMVWLVLAMVFVFGFSLLMQDKRAAQDSEDMNDTYGDGWPFDGD